MYVFGLLPPGDDPVSANYSIDGGPSKTGALSNSSAANTFIGNWSLFTSPQLKYGNHNISIIVNEAGQNGQQHQFTIFNYHVYRHGVYGVYIDIIIFKVITIRHERITTRHK